MRRLKVFLCHSHINRDIADSFNTVFTRYFGFDIFLAPDSLEIGEDWNPQIIRSLKSSRIIVPLVSEEFSQSQFAQQEIGLALAWKKKIIPVLLDDSSDKLGFLGIKQACLHSVLGNEIEEQVPVDEGYLKTGGKIFKEILVGENYSVLKHKIPALESAIFALSNSASYKTSIITAEILIEAEKTRSLSREQLRQVVDAVKTNSQIFESTYALPKLRGFLRDKYGVNIDGPGI